MPANCAEISRVTSDGGNWILRDLGPPEAKAFDRKYSSCICLWNTRDLENFVSFPLIYRFAGIRRVLTELEGDNWKHRSNYTVTLKVLFLERLPKASIGTTVLCVLTQLLTLIKWRDNWLCHHNKTCNLCVDNESSTFRWEKWLNTDNFIIDLTIL